MNTVLISGGAGFVGRHITKRFLDRGDKVCVVDPLVPKTGAIDPVKWPFYMPYDYNNFYFFKMDCREYFAHNMEAEFDYAVHLAAIVGGRLMIEDNPLAVAEDLAIDAAYWQWAAKARPRKTLCFSSSAAYPVCLQNEDIRGILLLKENMVDFKAQEIGIPDMSYGWAKLTHEFLAHLAYEKHGLDSVVYRPFSGYGEDQDMTYPFPSICKRVLDYRSICKRVLDYRHSPIIMVWGTGNQIRDFIHIEDCVDGIFKTMDVMHAGDTLNLSTGIATSIKTLTSTAAKLCGYVPQVVGNIHQPEGVFARVGDTAKQKHFGLEPKITLKEGLARALEYIEAKQS